MVTTSVDKLAGETGAGETDAAGGGTSAIAEDAKPSASRQAIRFLRSIGRMAISGRVDEWADVKSLAVVSDDPRLKRDRHAPVEVNATWEV